MKYRAENGSEVPQYTLDTTLGKYSSNNSPIKLTLTAVIFDKSFANWLRQFYVYWNPVHCSMTITGLLLTSYDSIIG